ncbi:nucleoside 2-deoxyribosyltransferase [Streptomyces sp. NBC_01549]|uniref:nucleoside 2-deoxyribosyltransferase n=1 Tax=Streptomyces sp. NBC_01549 TaxID=2975874 RepID=UPI002254FC9F|nr:nucleoside 2-deoxyribosyltransferase [Streptomyces sp. NBC_01549]MCX4595697.1 nucleoside 2-deoxyribosyltransferase [Streptomyces sp. NBC_01549]
MHYVAHRLFAAHDRALAADLADRLAVKLGEDQVFLPFCDTDEEDLIADIKGKRLFELDRDRLRRIRALIAIVHGPSPDDGVCMEIGYAAALGAPVIVMTTDFQDHSATLHGPRSVFPDPLLDALATRIVRVPRLGTPGEPTGGSRFADFAARNHTQIQEATEACVDAVVQLPSPAAATSRPSRDAHTVFVEPSPYTPARAGLPATTGTTVLHPTRFDAGDPFTAARHDWATALRSTRIVVDTSGPETPPGAALLIGAACATGQPVAAYLPHSTYTHAAGREPNFRNLMIQYGVDAVLRTPDEVTAWLGG